MTDFLKTDFSKMILFMLLGIVFAIVLLGFHKSGETRSSAVGTSSAPSGTRSTSPSGVSGDNPYDSSQLV